MLSQKARYAMHALLVLAEYTLWSKRLDPATMVIFEILYLQWYYPDWTIYLKTPPPTCEPAMKFGGHEFVCIENNLPRVEDEDLKYL